MNKVKRNLLVVLAGLGFALVGSHGYAGEFLVKYKNVEGMRTVQQMASFSANSMAVMYKHTPGNYMLVDLDKSNEAVTLAKLSADQNVEWVVPNFQLYALGNTEVTPAQLKDQWAIVKVQAQKAWDRASNKGRKGVVIAVIDTGVDYNHKSLAPNMVPGYDFKGNDSDPMDETGSQNPGHGTHCAGIAAATGLIDGGIIGIGPEISIMPLRFLGSDGSGDLNSAIRSIDYAIEKRVNVISASWGAAVPRSQATALIEAIQRADNAGVIFVAAAANDGKSNDTVDMFPANAGTPNMISVAASGSSDSKPSWSNYGKATVHLAAPGENIMSTLPKDQYGNLSGTSMATPLVSGLVAFLKSQDSSLTGAQIRALLQTSGAKVSIETACNCRVDAFTAVDHFLSKKMWLVPAANSVAENSSFSVSVMNGKAPFKFASSNPAILTVNDSGAVSTVAKGTATITVTDADGASVTSLDYNVGLSSDNGGGGGDCPLGDPMLCQIACQILPQLPFCN
ncbi:MAG: protease [Bdellovibrionales bacterium RBG_16_40_8]|nr:MAG: protease [Bdellovibrionales bacterium RBG_16_40_8]